MKWLLLLLALSGCSASTLDKAVLAANGAGAAGDTAAGALHRNCTERYQKAKADEVPAIDRYCLPAQKAFDAYRTAHAAFVAGIQSVRAGGDPATLPPLQTKLAAAAAAMSAALGELQ